MDESCNNIKGDWKILRLAKPFRTGAWQLYNLEKDPGESYDLSHQFPVKRDSLVNEWIQYAKENGVVDHHDIMIRYYWKVLPQNIDIL